MKKRYKISVILVMMFLLLGWRATRDITDSLQKNQLTLQEFFWRNSIVSSTSVPLLDNHALYGDGSQDTKVDTVYLVVLPSSDETGRPLTFSAMNKISSYHDVKPLLNAFFIDGGDQQIADIDALLANELPLNANATVTLRGHSTMASPTKSYKIKLNKNSAAWQGQTTLNLNKHPDDDSRMRNKIAFDLFRLIPNLTSMQTRYVHLYIKDLSDGRSASFVDYGLFTHIEQANAQFLKAHGLDEAGNLYKANYFEFLRYPENIKNTDDPTYDATAFEQNLEICAGTSHEKIIEMIEAVNNPLRDIDQVLDKYFNRDNYFTWLAVNILLGNYDTQTQNYFLYNPHDSLTWYFLPWDFDGSMFLRIKADTEGKSAQLVGIANYWGNVLHSRVFKKENNITELNSRIESVYQILMNGCMDQEIDKYQPLIEQYYLKSPIFGKEFTAVEFYDNIGYIRNVVRLNHELYYATIEKPMPVFLGEIQSTSTGTRFSWSESYDLQGDRISYSLQICRDSLFLDLVFEKKRLTTTQFIVDLQPGTYYWRVVVSDNKGETQRAFDVFWEEGVLRIVRNGIYGVKKIKVGE